MLLLFKCFPCFLNCKNGTKSLKTPHIQYFLTFLNIYITLPSLKIRKKRQKKG